MNHYTVIGIMSGTSLDGLDISLIHFKQEAGRWDYTFKTSVTKAYTEEWRKRLDVLNAKHESALSINKLVNLERDYSLLLAQLIKNFLKENQVSPSAVDFIASHGHTLFHEPERGITKQIGSGAILSALTGISCYSDFRTADVALGGQGAPLVPIGDALLFSDYDACINLGGFANISFMQRAEPIAFDICPLNLLLNKQAQKLGFDFDRNGKLASTGQVQQPLLKKLNTLNFYQQGPPKSLGVEWIVSNIDPILDKYALEEKDILATLVEHMADQIGANLNRFKVKKALVTGGGTYNKFLLARIQSKTKTQLVIPDAQTIEFKEALVFGLLAVLAHRKEVNVLSRITGASKDHSAGSFHLGTDT